MLREVMAAEAGGASHQELSPPPHPNMGTFQQKPDWGGGVDQVTGEGMSLEGIEGTVPGLGRAPDAGESWNIPGANMAE